MEPESLLKNVHIDSLAYGAGHGVGRVDGKVVFVEDACPGDVVDVTVTESKPRMDFGVIAEFHEPSPRRRVPPCPHARECGGCSWQHILYEEQLDRKREILHDHLKRLGGFEALEPSLLHGEEFGFRAKARFHFDDAGRFGFYAKRSQNVVVFDRCLLLQPRLASLVAAFRKALEGKPTLSGELELGVGIDGLGVACLHTPTPIGRDAARYLLKTVPGLKGVSVFHNHRRQDEGDTQALFHLAESHQPYGQQVGDFWQSNTCVNRLVQKTASKLLSPLGCGRILELFGGSGNLTLLLADLAPVLMVEQNPSACASAKRNLELAKPRFDVSVESVEAKKRMVQLIRDGQCFDTLVMDPPRAGFPGGLANLDTLGVKNLLYLSCNPSTLARDLSEARSLGFKLVSATLVDFFPQTYHVESLVLLTKP